MNPPANSNYAATVIRIRKLVTLEGLDNLVGVPTMGYQALVGKGQFTEGDLALAFSPETQLSDTYAAANNLYRHPERNSDTTKTGYLEDNQRVRAIRLRGHVSNALIMPLNSVAFTGQDISNLVREGDQFDTLNGIEICRKYVIPQRYPVKQNKQAAEVESIVEAKYFPEHFDTQNFFRVAERNALPVGPCVVTQKLHGTSVRIGTVPVRRKLGFVERLAARFGARVDRYQYEQVAGSRRVVKGISDNHNHYYGHDIYSEVARSVEGILPKGMMLYGEIIGWVGSRPIQEHYTYDCTPGTWKLFVYRLSIINPDGLEIDLSWPAVQEFCRNNGLNPVPTMEVLQFGPTPATIETFLDVKFCERPGWGYLEPVVPLAEDSPCDEGVCVRWEGIRPTILKAKSPVFLGHETRMLDAGKDTDG